MRSIKTKLIVGLSALIIFLFSVTAFLLIDEKERELTHDIYIQARNFSELTTPKIVDLYRTYLAEGSFALFNREMVTDVFKKNTDVSRVRVLSFAGDLLFDSDTEKDRQYEGSVRKVDDNDLLARIKSNNPSFLIEQTKRVVYLKKDQEGNYLALNENENLVPEISDTEKIVNITFPFENKFAVVFDVSYANLLARVRQTTERIVYLLVFGIMLGLAFGWYFATRITEPIKKLSISAEIIGKGNFSERVKVRGRDEVAMLGQTFNTMAAELEKSIQAKIYQERVSKELELAAEIQRQILPKELPKLASVDIAAGLVPAAEIGGDCYDFIIGGEEDCTFYIGDVTGHGVPSGMVASVANALLYSYSNEKNLTDILIATNRVLRAKTKQNMFMTMILGRFHGKNGQLDYVSAGHPQMVQFSAKSKKVVELAGGGIALGMTPDIQKTLKENTISMEKDDCLILYSDGIPEAVNEGGNEQYGASRLKRALSEYGDLPTAQAIQKALLSDVQGFMGKSIQNDDITILVLKRR